MLVRRSLNSWCTVVCRRRMCGRRRGVYGLDLRSQRAFCSLSDSGILDNVAFAAQQSFSWSNITAVTQTEDRYKVLYGGL